MELVIGGLGAVSIINTLSKDIIMKTIQRSIISTYGTVKWFANYDQPYAKDIISQINSLDLQFNITLIGNLLQDLHNYKVESKAIVYALDAVSTQLDIVHGELKDLQTAIEKHRYKFFNNWRCINSRCSIGTLINHNHILQNRYQELLKLLNICDKKLS